MKSLRHFDIEVKMMLNEPRDSCLNYWSPGDLNKIYVSNLKLILVMDGWGLSCENALGMSTDPIDDWSALVQVMTWCRQAASHHMSQNWPRSMASLGHNELTHQDPAMHINAR